MFSILCFYFFTLIFHYKIQSEHYSRLHLSTRSLCSVWLLMVIICFVPLEALRFAAAKMVILWEYGSLLPGILQQGQNQQWDRKLVLWKLLLQNRDIWWPSLFPSCTAPVCSDDIEGCLCGVAGRTRPALDEWFGGQGVSAGWTGHFSQNTPRVCR